MPSGVEAVEQVDLDAVAIKPTETAPERAIELPVDHITIDYEGTDAVPPPRTLRTLGDEIDVRVTVAVRADGFDPLGDTSLYDRIPETARHIFVAGHQAYLTTAEQSKAIAPRLHAALNRGRSPWVGTEGIERLALATGAPQFELLSPTTARDIEALYSAGFSGEFAVYAPTVLSDDPDIILDGVGSYVARRAPVRQRLPPDATTDRHATGQTREILLEAAHEYALIGDIGSINRRIQSLKAAGAETLVGYPARGLDSFLGN